MPLIVVLLAVAIVWLWIGTGSLRDRLRYLEDQLATARDEIRELTGRLMRLEHQSAPAAAPVSEGATTIPPPIVAPPIMAPPPIVAPTVIAAPPIIDARAQVARTGATAVTPTVALVTAPPIRPAAVEPAPEPAPSARAESWEMVVGTSWLNKIGVLVFIVGVALLVAYSFGHVGPAGRVAIGFVLSFGMLGAGVILERRAAFRNYAYGLVAGGWAGVYFTTFAMHDVPAARILESDLAAVVLLMLVAAGMIAHSLRYRSQVVTALAFVVAYATLALSPLSGFSLAASVPLAVSVLAVSQRLGWSGVSALGVGATYGVFVLRSIAFPGGAMDPSSALPYTTLAAYWLTFEAADIVGLRLRSRAAEALASAPAPVLALNALGFIGSLLLIIRIDDAALLSAWLSGAAAAYCASAVLRAWLLPGWRARHSRNEPFDSAHGAVAIAAGLFAVAIGLRFTGNRAGLARLLEAQLLLTAGLTLADVWLRRLGSAAMVLAALHAGLLGVLAGTGAHVISWAPGTTSGLMMLAAVACFGSREAIHRRAEQPTWFEDGYTWMATGLLAVMLVRELTPAHEALAGVALAVLLLEVGFRRGMEYVLQSYTLGALASYELLAVFVIPATEAAGFGPLGPAPTAVDAWLVLPAGAVLAAAAAWRLATGRPETTIPGRQLAAGVWAAIASALLAVFEWRVLSPHAIAPAWALTSLGFVALGQWRRDRTFRWRGYALALAAVVRAAGPLLAGPPQSTTELAAAIVVIAVTYAAAYVGRRAWIASDDGADPALVLVIVPAVATILLAMLEWRMVPDLGIGPSWAATGVLLLALGLWRQAEDLRWQSYVLLALGALRAGQPVFGVESATTAAWMWLAAVIGMLYACGLVVGRSVRAAADTKTESGEDAVSAVLLLGATGLLAALVYREVRPSMVTLALGMQGLASMFTGLLARDRVLRLSGLALLLACILKLFLYDLRELEALARIMSFVALGLIMLAISWAYTRYREQIRKFL